MSYIKTKKYHWNSNSLEASSGVVPSENNSKMFKTFVCVVAAVACGTVLAEVPTGCVTIQSRYSDKYLTTSTRYNCDRRYVKQSDEPQEWNVVKEGGYYRIVHKNREEELYAAGINYSGQDRYVFTWVDGAAGDQAKWDIVDAARADGQVLIRNLYYNEHLYAAAFDDFVFSWRPTDPVNGDEKFYWNVTQC